MLVIIRIVCITSIIMSTYAVQTYILAGTRDIEGISLKDIWTEGEQLIDNRNYIVNQTLIKMWNKLTPFQIRMMFKDVNSDVFSRIYFNGSSTESNISSWLSNQTFLKLVSYNIVQTHGLIIHTRGDNISLVPSTGDTSKVYVYIGKININSSTNSTNVALLTKDGYPHEITEDLLESIENHEGNVIISGFMSVSNETFQKLELPNKIRYYVNGLTITTESSSWSFSLYYNSWGCDDRFAHRYKQYQNFPVLAENITIKFNVISAACIKLELSDNIYNFSYTIYEIDTPLVPIDEIVVKGVYRDEDEQQYLNSLFVDQTTSPTTDVISTMALQSTDMNVTFSASETTTSTTDVTSDTPTTVTDETSSATPSQFTTEIGTSSVLYTTTVNGCGCCRNTNNYTIITDDELDEIVKKIQRDLGVNRSELSRSIRKKTSAPDGRPTAAASGYISGTILFCVIFLIVFSDLPLLIKTAKKCIKIIRQRFLHK